MNQVPESHHVGQIGVLAVAKMIHMELKWVFRPQQQDYGIDGEIEVISDHFATGKLIAAQVKSGRSYFAEEDNNGIVFRGGLDHLHYWLDHVLPVIVVLYDADRDQAYWQNVSRNHVTETPQGWKMLIPRGQTLEASQMSALEEVASQRHELIKSILCPFCGAPLSERGGVPVGTEHTGLIEIFECGYRALDSSLERPCPLDPRFPRLDDYELRSHPPATSNNAWFCLAIPKTDMARKLELHHGWGRSREDAENRIRSQYESYAARRQPQGLLFHRRKLLRLRAK